MTKRDELEAALALAEAALAEAIIAGSKPDALSADTGIRLESARACCRRAHTALAELNQSESVTSSRDALDTLIQDLKGLPIRRATASSPSRQLHEEAFRGVDRRAPDQSGQPKQTRGSTLGPSVRERRPGNARAWSSLLRQTIGLLAVILTYLLYFHIDVQLQIVRLPSVFPWSLQ